MNKTPIIVVIVAIIVLCCCSMCVLLWTIHIWQQANESDLYEESSFDTSFYGDLAESDVVFMVGQTGQQGNQEGMVI